MQSEIVESRIIFEIKLVFSNCVAIVRFLRPFKNTFTVQSSLK